MACRMRRGTYCCFELSTITSYSFVRHSYPLIKFKSFCLLKEIRYGCLQLLCRCRNSRVNRLRVSSENAHHFVADDDIHALLQVQWYA
ncbi:unnamed protein product [Ilex paraguariensis]|uniref:Uncharacterized protein n=1 Tax=Ilex paraguariensis TaxID=185542 RepID=A0ABC8TXU6_9AQUA